MNMLFTYQALRKEEETLEFLEKFHRRLLKAKGLKQRLFEKVLQ